MKSIFNLIDAAYDKVHSAWESRFNKRIICITLIIVYLLSLLVIEAARFKLLPESIAVNLPSNHFYAITFAFTLLLYFEVIDLVFSITKSFSISVGKQFEIFSLILLRQSFKEFQSIRQPVLWDQTPDVFLHILSDAGGALLIFAILALFYKFLRHQPYIKDDEESIVFIVTKKAISLTLLLIFNLTGLFYLFGLNTGGDFFATFYTVLVFSDILIVLISLYYSDEYAVVFRNSGFALSTVLLRIALTAPIYMNALIGVFSSVYILLIIFIYNRHLPAFDEIKGVEEE